MYYEDFFGITAPIGAIIDRGVIDKLGKYRNTDLFVKQNEECLAFLNSLKLYPTGLVNQKVAELFELNALELRKRLLAKDQSIMEAVERLTPIYGEIKDEINNISITEDEKKILMWFYTNKSKFEDYKYEDDLFEIFDIDLNLLTQGKRLFLLYKNYKDKVYRDISEERVNYYLRKINNVKEIILPTSSTNKVISLDEHRLDEDVDFINTQNLSVEGNVEFKNIYSHICLNTNSSSLNLIFGLNLKEEDYYSIGLKFNQLGFIGFNPFTKELFKQFIVENKINSKKYPYNTEFMTRLKLIESDLLSLKGRLANE